MECRQKRPNQVNKQGSVGDSRPSRNSFRIRKRAKPKSTQTEDLNYSSSTSSSGTSESCTNSSDEDPHQTAQQSTIHDRLGPNRHLRKPSSLKHRKAMLSDSNDEYYYTHPPSPQTQSTSNQSFSTNTNSPALQLIPRGPLICSDSFEKWNDRSFTWNRPLPPATLLSSAPSTSTGTSDSTISITPTTKTDVDTEDKLEQLSTFGQASFLEGDVSDDDDSEARRFIERKPVRPVGPASSRTRSTKTAAYKDVGPSTSSILPSSLDNIDGDDATCYSNEANTQSVKSMMNFGSSENLHPRKLSLTESLRSLPIKPDRNQQEIVARLRQAEEVSERVDRENDCARVSISVAFVSRTGNTCADSHGYSFKVNSGDVERDACY